MKKILLFFMFCLVTFAYPEFNGYAIDSANLIGDEEFFVSNTEKLKAIDGAEIGIITTEDFGGETIEAFSNGIFRKWRLGDKNKNNGILIVVNPRNRECRIEVGYGLEGTINDAKAGDIVREQMIPNFKNGGYEKGIKEAYIEIYRLVGGIDLVAEKVEKIFIELPERQGFINDYSKIMDKEFEKSMEFKLKKLLYEKGISIIYFSMVDFGNYSYMDYAENIINQWNLDKENTIILMVDSMNKKSMVSVAEGVRRYFLESDFSFVRNELRNLQLEDGINYIYSILADGTNNKYSMVEEKQELVIDKLGKIPTENKRAIARNLQGLNKSRSLNSLVLAVDNLNGMRINDYIDKVISLNNINRVSIFLLQYISFCQIQNAVLIDQKFAQRYI